MLLQKYWEYLFKKKTKIKPGEKFLNEDSDTVNCFDEYFEIFCKWIIAIKILKIYNPLESNAVVCIIVKNCNNKTKSEICYFPSILIEMYLELEV